jgi:hypothetical protein
MKPEEETAFKEKLAKEFILIPKNRLYHAIGGALAILVFAFGINIGSVVAYLRTEPAEKELERIKQISTEVQKHYDDMGIGTFVKLNEPYHIRPVKPDGTTCDLDLHVHRNQYANATTINLSDDTRYTWKLFREEQ